MKMELRDATPERLGHTPNIDLKVTQLVTVTFEPNVFEYTRSGDGSFVSEGYESDSIFHNQRGITEWSESRDYGIVKVSEPGFLRGFPVLKSKDGKCEQRCIELFFNYTDIYGSSLVISLGSLRSMYMHSQLESELEALKHDTEVDQSIGNFQALISQKGRTAILNEVDLSYDLLDSFINEAAKTPKDKVFDFDTDDLRGAYVKDSPTGLMIVRQKSL